QKWDRYGPDQEIELIGDMSRLTFDTIGLCAYGYRFNQFYSEKPHHFETELKEAIIESGRRANRPDVLNRWWYYKDEEHRQENIVKIRSLCESIIQERIDHPKPDANDLLNVMIHGIDKETGEKLGFDNVCYQIPTLLGGGYETTSSTLSFLFYFLCDTPQALRKAQAEVDEVIGDKVLTYDMLPNLKYLDACIKETLRMQHPVSLLTRFSTKDTVIGGKYFIRKGQMVSGIWRHFHRDKNAWGEDADVYRPERMLDAEFQKMPPNAWKPVSADHKTLAGLRWRYGDGLRACIGRGFAEQEMLICLAMVLQKFDIEKVDPDYKLQLKGQMGVKPIDLFIRARRRPGVSANVGIPGGQYGSKGSGLQAPSAKPACVLPVDGPLKPISVLWGGNQGTCESLVESLVRMAPSYGLKVADIRDLDSAVNALPKDMPCVIITPSYEGRAPYNALKFVAWLDKLAAEADLGASDESRLAAAGVDFTVFGAGNSDWVHSFHRIPKLISTRLQELGGRLVFEPGYANVKRELLGPWEEWSDRLCLTLSSSGATPKTRQVEQTAGVEVLITKPTSTSIGAASQNDIVSRVPAISHIGGTVGDPAKRHMDVLLPKGSTYKTGDYLAVLGRNSDETVSRVLSRFGLNEDDLISVSASSKAFLPTNPTPIGQFLRYNVELALPVTQRQLVILAASAAASSQNEPAEVAKLTALHSSDEVYQSLLDRRFSVIDVLDEVPSIVVPFGVYLDMLLPLSTRLYSIASSPLAPGSAPSESSNGRLTASLTVDIFQAPAMSGHGVFHGVASAHLAHLTPGSQVLGAVRRTKLAFQLPEKKGTPIIMLAAGSGIAPMRALLQERAALGLEKKQKQHNAPLLVFGCRNENHDYLYRSELEQWEAQGHVEVVPCFSRPGEQNLDTMNAKKPAGGVYVPDKMWDMRDRLWELVEEKGAKVYICGSAARLGRSCAETWRRICMEKTGKSLDEAFEWFEEISQRQQYVSDLY
ncbi:cytochrome P450, partial [Microdochium trichocladiopsis]